MWDGREEKKPKEGKKDEPFVWIYWKEACHECDLIDWAHLPWVSPAPEVRDGPDTSLVTAKQCSPYPEGWA